jgi:hypothetical protein
LRALLLFAAVGEEGRNGENAREPADETRAVRLVDGPKGETRPGRLGSQAETYGPVCFVLYSHPCFMRFSKKKNMLHEIIS